MNNLVGNLLGLLVLLAGATLAVVEQVPLLTDALTGAGIGAFIGGAMAYRRERIAARERRLQAVSSRWIISRWTSMGACAGLLVHLAAAVL